MATNQAFTIAISGCSSAGKSTLAFLLSEIFENVGVDVSDIIGHEASRNNNPSPTKDSNTPSKSQKVSIIHGDEFFMPKHLCPLITFTSTSADTAFCQASLLNDEIGQYFISWNGTRANDKFMTHRTSIDATTNEVPTTVADPIAAAPDDLLKPKPEGKRNQSNESVMTTFSMADTLHEGGRKKVFTVSGPDTDCDEAVNFVGMFGKLKELSRGDSAIENVALSLGKPEIKKDGGVMGTQLEPDHNDGFVLSPEKLDREKDGGAERSGQNVEIDGNKPKYSHHYIDIEALRTQYADLIAQMRERVQQFLKEIILATTKTSKSTSWFKPAPQQLLRINSDSIATFLPKIIIIESFLLFTQPSTLTPSDYNPNVTRLTSILRTFLARLSSISSALASKDGVDPALEIEREYVEKNIWILNNACKKGMMGFFDVCLFLGSSREMARRRRFGRGVYRDDEGRRPGQMWKAEGYWDQVAWGNFLGANGWLVSVEEGERKGGYNMEGVHIRGEDWEVVETVEWAMGCVLEEIRGVVCGQVEGRGDEGGFI